MEAVIIHPSSRHRDFIGECQEIKAIYDTAYGCVCEKNLGAEGSRDRYVRFKMLQLHYCRPFVLQITFSQITHRESQSTTVTQISNHIMLEMSLRLNCWKQCC